MWLTEGKAGVLQLLPFHQNSSFRDFSKYCLQQYDLTVVCISPGVIFLGCVRRKILNNSLLCCSWIQAIQFQGQGWPGLNSWPQALTQHAMSPCRLHATRALGQPIQGLDWRLASTTVLLYQQFPIPVLGILFENYWGILNFEAANPGSSPASHHLNAKLNDPTNV